MDKEQIIREMRKLHDLRNPETSHYLGDELLCKLLCSLGYSEVVYEWQKLPKWYT